MIYMKDDHQDKLVTDHGDFSMEINGDPKVLAAELTMVLHTLYHIDSRIVSAAIKTFWEMDKDDSRTE